MSIPIYNPNKFQRRAEEQEATLESGRRVSDNLMAELEAAWQDDEDQKMNKAKADLRMVMQAYFHHNGEHFFDLLAPNAVSTVMAWFTKSLPTPVAALFTPSASAPTFRTSAQQRSAENVWRIEAADEKPQMPPFFLSDFNRFVAGLKHLGHEYLIADAARAIILMLQGTRNAIRNRILHAISQANDEDVRRINTVLEEKGTVLFKVFRVALAAAHSFASVETKGKRLGYGHTPNTAPFGGRGFGGASGFLDKWREARNYIAAHDGVGSAAGDYADSQQESLEQELYEARERISFLEAKLVDTERKLGQRVDELATANARVNLLHQTVDALRDEQAEMRADTDRAWEEWEQQRAMVEQLQTELKACKAKLSGNDIPDATLSEMRQTVRRLLDSNARLQRKLDKKSLSAAYYRDIHGSDNSEDE